MSKKGPVYTTFKDLSTARKQGLAEAVFEFDEGLTQWSPEKPAKTALTASPVSSSINEKRNDVRNAAINAITHARHHVKIQPPKSTIVPVAKQEVGFVVAETVQPSKAVRKLFT